MLPRKANSDYITRLECITTSSDIKRDLSAIKTALIGADMQGGLVNKFNDIESKLDLQGGIVNKMNDIDKKLVELATKAETRDKANGVKEAKAEAKEKTAAENYSREKVALIGFASAIIGIIVGHILDIINALVS